MHYITVEYIQSLVILTLNRPQKHNAFNLQLLREMEEAFSDLAGNPDVRLAIMTGAGNKSFSSGVDLAELIKFKNLAEARRFALQLEETNAALLRFPKPLIAAINGYAFGGGFGLASSADVRIMVEDSKIGFPAVRLGAILPVGCTLRLNALIGSGRSRELLLTGRIVEAREALQIGLVNAITSRESLMDEAKRIAEEILKGSDLALEMTKQMTNQELLSQLQQYSVSAAENFAYLAFTDEWQKRIRDFMKKAEKK